MSYLFWIYYMWFLRTNRFGDIDPKWLLGIFCILAVFEFGKYIINSWMWVNVIVFIFVGWILFYGLKFIEKKRKEKPTSLWKEFELKYPIITQYEPPKNLNPAEAWLLYNCKVDTTDLTSLIYQWAYEWLIIIKNVRWNEEWKSIKKIQLVKLRDIEPNRPFFEVEIFNSIFSVGPTKIIEDSFQIRYALLLEDLEFHGIRKGWLYRKTVWWVLKFVYWVLLIMLYVSLYRLIRTLIEWTWWFLVSIFVFLVLLLACIFLWWYMDGWTGLRLTDKWAKLASYVIWYRNFIKWCDENILKLYLKNDPLFLDKTLPYATAFWLETEFLKKISPLGVNMKAKYVNWHKVSWAMKIIAFLLHPINTGYNW